MKYDVYLFDDCKVLKNKLGIKDEAELDKAESEFASISMMGLMNSGFYESGTHSFVVGDDVQTDYIMRKDL